MSSCTGIIFSHGKAPDNRTQQTSLSGKGDQILRRRSANEQWIFGSFQNDVYFVQTATGNQCQIKTARYIIRVLTSSTAKQNIKRNCRSGLVSFFCLFSSILSKTSKIVSVLAQCQQKKALLWHAHYCCFVHTLTKANFVTSM